MDLSLMALSMTFEFYNSSGTITHYGAWANTWVDSCFSSGTAVLSSTEIKLSLTIYQNNDSYNCAIQNLTYLEVLINEQYISSTIIRLNDTL